MLKTLRAFLLPSLIFGLVPASQIEGAAPSVFNGFDGDPAWYAMASGDGRVLAGWEVPHSGPLRGVTRRWDGETWVRTEMEPTSGLGAISRAISADGNVIAGQTEASGLDFRTGVAVWFWEDSVWARTDLNPEDPHGDVTGMSDDGRVIIGYTGGGYGAGEPSVWEFSDETGSWRHTLLPKPRPFERVGVSLISADGTVLVGGTYQPVPPYRRQAIIWQKGEGEGWSPTLLPFDEGAAVGNAISAFSRDGKTLVGHMMGTSPAFSVGRYVWNFNGESWVWTRLPEIIRNGNSSPYAVSADGGVIVGIGDWSPNLTSVRVAWRKSEKGEWGVLFRGSRKQTAEFPDSLTSDGRLALVQTDWTGHRVWNLISGRLLTMQSLVAGLDLNEASAGWDFSRGELFWASYSARDNTYTILGLGHKDGVATTCVISLYAPFLTGEHPTVGGWVDVDLPDMGEEGYRMGVLPPGLRYDRAERRIYGQATQIGTFTVRYRNLTTGRAKESILRVVGFAPRQQGVKVLPLVPIDAGDEGEIAATSEGRLRIKVGKTGGAVLHFDPPGGGKRFTFSGVFVPDAEDDLSKLRAKRSSEETGRVLRRGKGLSAVEYRLEVQMTKAGAVSARVFGSGGELLAAGELAGP